MQPECKQWLDMLDASLTAVLEDFLERDARTTIEWFVANNLNPAAVSVLVAERLTLIVESVAEASDHWPRARRGLSALRHNAERTPGYSAR